MIPAPLQTLIRDWSLGMVATVDPEGAPSLSPKGTFLVLDDATLGFAEIRSPNTLRNIAHDPRVEINFIDVLARKGGRFKGKARFAERNSEEFREHYPRFEAGWPDLADRFNGIVLIDVTEAKPVTSPVYDDGTTEQELCAHWLARFTELQETRK